MDFNFTEEQQLLADTVRRFVREHYSFEARREILKSKDGWSRELWQQLAGLGLTALNVPEAHGGLGAGPVDTMLVMNALGEGLVLEPYLSAAVITPALLDRIGDDKAAGGSAARNRCGRAHRDRRAPGTEDTRRAESRRDARREER